MKLHKLPADAITHVVQAYAYAVDHVFLWAVPVAVLGLVLALVLKEVPLRGTERAGATDLGEAFAMPQGQDSQQRLERAVAGVLRQDRGRSFGAIVSRSGANLNGATLWGLMQVLLRGRVTAGDPVTIATIATDHRVPPGVLEPFFDRLAGAGLITIDGEALSLAAAGYDQVRMFTAALKAWVVEQLADWDIEPESEQISRALDHIATRLVRDEANRQPVLQPA
jgi:hypothetical protein